MQINEFTTLISSTPFLTAEAKEQYISEAPTYSSEYIDAIAKILHDEEAVFSAAVAAHDQAKAQAELATVAQRLANLRQAEAAIRTQEESKLSQIEAAIQAI